jgi:hypothetical protein
MGESAYSFMNEVVGVADLNAGDLADCSHIKDWMRMQ